jgi:hypothetical protein
MRSSLLKEQDSSAIAGHHHASTLNRKSWVYQVDLLLRIRCIHYLEQRNERYDVVVNLGHVQKYRVYSSSYVTCRSKSTE